MNAVAIPVRAEPKDPPKAEALTHIPDGGRETHPPGGAVPKAKEKSILDSVEDALRRRDFKRAIEISEKFIARDASPPPRLKALYSDALLNQAEILSERDKTVLLSSAYLYEGARRSDLRRIHADWPDRPAHSETTWEGEALTCLKPAKLIITQFDYYRRYETVLARLRARADLVEIKIHNTAKIPSPDSIKSFQRVVQHVAWAPAVVEFSWR